MAVRGPRPEPRGWGAAQRVFPNKMSFDMVFVIVVSCPRHIGVPVLKHINGFHRRV